MNTLIAIGVVLIAIVVSGVLFFVPIGLGLVGERLAGNKAGQGTPPLNINTESFESWD